MIARRFPALALALLGVTACTSTPSTQTVAEEVIEALDVPQGVKDCMTERLENYSNDELDAIGEANPNFTSARTDIPMTPELEDFMADLAECTDGTASGEPSDDTTADITATTGG